MQVLQEENLKRVKNGNPRFLQVEFKGYAYRYSFSLDGLYFWNESPDHSKLQFIAAPHEMEHESFIILYGVP